MLVLQRHQLVELWYASVLESDELGAASAQCSSAAQAVVARSLRLGCQRDTEIPTGRTLTQAET